MSIDEQVRVEDGSADLQFENLTSQVIDLVEVERIQSEALIRAGYAITDDDDDTVRSSYTKLQAGVLQAMLERHVVRGKRDLKTGAVTKFELYQEMLPDAPGVQVVADSPEEKAAQDGLMKKLWSYLNTGTTGYVQKNAAGEAYVLCEAPVSRTKVSEENGRREPSTEQGRFLTDDGELILTHFTNPAGAAFIKAARKLDAQLGLVGMRRPELAASVAKQVGAMVKQAVNAVPHADPKQITALTAGNGTDAGDDQ